MTLAVNLPAGLHTEGMQTGFSKKDSSEITGGIASDPVSAEDNPGSGESFIGNFIPVNSVKGAEAGNYSLAQLKEFSETVIKKRFEQLDGVSQAVVSGGFHREIEVKVDPQKLQSFGLSFEDIKNALKNSNLNLEGGSINEGVFRYL